jgi:hypothetical protein
MPEQPSIERTRALERDILRAICCGSKLSGSALEDALRDLEDYRWQSAEHRIVYAAVAALQRSRGESLVEQLAAQATRMGFPDVDWELYLKASEGARTDVPAMIRALKAVAKELLL